MLNPYNNPKLGPYGQHTGGTQGRPGYLHKGMQTKSSGGTNAKTSGKKVGPGQFFQYGHNQWAYMRNGKIDWNAKNPYKKDGSIQFGATVGNWQKIRKRLQAQNHPGLANMPTAQTKPHFWDADPIYNQKWEQANSALQDKLDSSERQMADYKANFDLYGNQLKDSFEKDFTAKTASLASRGFGGSGVERKTNTDRQSQFDEQQAELTRQYGKPAQDRLNAQTDRYQTEFDRYEAALQDEAKDAYELTHDAPPDPQNTPPKPNKQVLGPYSKRGSTWFYTSKDGRTVSLGAKTPIAVQINNLKQAIRSGGKSAEQKKKLRAQIAALRGQAGG